MRKLKSFLTTLSTDSDDWGGYTLRQVIPAGSLTQQGDAVSIRFETRTGNGAAIASAWIGHSATTGSSDIDFGGAPVRLTFAGANSITMAASSVAESDLVEFALDDTRDLVVSIFVSAGGSQNFRAQGILSGAIAKYNVGDFADDTGDVESGGAWSASGRALVAVSAVLVSAAGVQRYDDTLDPAVVVGSWGLRQLVSGYTGALVRIRDTDDDSEQDVGFDGNGNLDSFSVVGTARVVRVYDQSGGDDLIQATNARQPTLLPAGTPRGTPAISFDDSNQEHLYGETAGTARPYMVTNPVVVFGMGGGGTSSAYASIVKIANADGSNASPYYRLTIERDSSTDLMRLGINGGAYTSFDFSGYGNVQDGWMVLVASTLTAQGYAGVRGTRPFEFGATDVTYPNSTRLFVAANGAGGENWGGYFTELVILDNADLSASEWVRFAEDIRIKTMVPAQNGIEWRMLFTDNFSGSDNSISFAEIEFHATLGAGSDMLPAGGTGIRVYPIASFNSSENGPKLFDDNLSTQWSSSNLGVITYALNFQLPSALMPAEIELIARSDGFNDLMAKLFTIECLINDEWVSRGAFDLTSDGVSAGQSYPLELEAVEGIESITPSLGSTLGGTSVTIEGSGFIDVVDVFFGTAPAESVVVVDDSEITCITPAHAAGTVDVTLTRLSPLTDIVGVSAFIFADIPPPVFGSIAPAQGSTAGGTAVTIIGDNFDFVTGIRFGGVAATSVVVVDTQTITCVTPAFVVQGLVDVTIEDPSGDVEVAYAFEYTVQMRVSQLPLLIVEVSTQPARISQLATLILTVPPQPARITQMPVLPFFVLDPQKPDPILPLWPMEEVWQWYTTIASKRGGTEQRMALRTTPRIEHRYTLPALDDAERTRLLYTLYRYVGNFIKFPAFQYQVDIDSPALTNDKVFCQTDMSNFRVGEGAIVYERNMLDYEIGIVADIDTDGVVFTQPLSMSVEPGYRVAPLVECKLPDPVSYSVDSVGNSTSNLTFLLDPNREFLRPGQVDSVQLYDNMPVVLDRHFVSGSNTEAISKGFEDFSNALAKDIPYTRWVTGKMTTPRRYFVEHDEIDKWRALAALLLGRQKTFLLPTWRNDFTLSPVASPGGTALFTNENWVHDFFKSRAYGYLMLHQATGDSVVRKVLNSTLNMDRTVMLTIDQAVPSDTLPQVSMVSKNRMGSDEIRLTHHVNHVEVALTAVSVDA